MSLAYYRFFPGDYMRDTMHLGWYEDLAYRRLIDLYLLHGKPIRNDRAYIMRAVRAFEPEQQAAVDTILAEMFDLRADGWHQKRCDAELARVNERVEAARQAGLASAAKRTLNDRSTDVQRMSTNQNQNQNQNQKTTTPTTKPKPTPVAALPADLAVSAEVWQQFREHRKAIRAPMTGRAESLLAKRIQELTATGEDAVKVIEQSIERGWKGLFAVHTDAGRPRASGRSKADRIASINEEMWKGRKRDDSIDGTAERVD